MPSASQAVLGFDHWMKGSGHAVEERAGELLTVDMHMPGQPGIPPPPTSPHLLHQEGLLHHLGVQRPQPLHGLVLPLAGLELLGGAERVFQ